jgi:hypothetical protein
MSEFRAVGTISISDGVDLLAEGTTDDNRIDFAGADEFKCFFGLTEPSPQVLDLSIIDFRRANVRTYHERKRK